MARARRPFFCGNWKLNGSIAESLALATEVRNGVATFREVDVAVAPSFTALYAVAESFYFAPSLLLGGAKYLTVFSPEQINALVLLSFRMFQSIGGLFLVFYGAGWMIRGYLIYRSGYLPKWLGVLLAIGGFGFVAQTFSFVLAPRYGPDVAPSRGATPPTARAGADALLSAPG